MNVPIEVPEDIAHQLEARCGDISHLALEALAIEGYRAGAITAAQVQRMLGMSSRWHVEAFLKRAQAFLDYSEADLDRDVAAIRNAGRG